MILETARQVREGLSELIRLVNDPGTSAGDLRAVLAESKAFDAQVAMLQADAAVGVSIRERHGDSGVGVLAQAAGLSRREAAGQVKTAQRLESMPAVRDAVESGQVSFANAKVLADACDKTSAEQVEQNPGLLKEAAESSPERLAREVGRWAAQRQADGGEDRFRRQRARRRLSIWDGEGGMVHLRGELDPVMGAKMRKRLLKEAERLRREDLHSPGGQKRRFSQRMADALDTLTSNSDSKGGGSRPSADIAIVQHLSADGTAAFAEIAGSGTIPRSVFEEHMCNAEITGVAFSHKGVPLWQGPTKRTATPAQMTALRAKYGGCGGCGAHVALCQAHHIKPVSQGGATDITNMMLLCWGCHRKVHHHDWRVVSTGDTYTIEPPERIRYGPARPPAHRPAKRRAAEDSAPANSQPRRNGTMPARPAPPAPARSGTALFLHPPRADSAGEGPPAPVRSGTAVLGQGGGDQPETRTASSRPADSDRAPRRQTGPMFSGY